MMKTTLFLLLFLPSCLLGQLRLEFINRTEIANYAVYPISEQQKVYANDYNPDENSVVQTKNGQQFRLVHLFKKVSKKERKKWNEFHFTSIATSDDIEIGIPPCLDSLPDGNYKQFYQQVPIYKNDTLFFVDTIVHASFSIKNGLFEGIAKWYYPNGLLYQEGFYSNGQATGQWLAQKIGQWRAPNEIASFSLIKTSYSNNRKDGISKITNFYKSNDGTTRTNLTETAYSQGILNGHFRVFTNGLLHTSGDFKNGVKSGYWEINKENDAGEFIPFFKGAFNTDSVYQFSSLPKSPDFYYEKPAVFFGSRPVNSGQVIDGVYYSYSDPGRPFIQEIPFDEFIIKSLYDTYSIPNRIKMTLTDSGYKPKEIYLFEMEWNPLSDSLGNELTPEEIPKKNGFLFKYMDSVSWYHPNGQLKVSINFSDSISCQNFIVLYPNAKIEYQISTSNDGSSIEIWNDSLGVKSQEIHSKPNGQETYRFFDPEYLNLEGKRFFNFNNIYWSYENNRSFTLKDNDTLLRKIERSILDSTITKMVAFHPATRIGKTKQFSSNHSFQNQFVFQFDTSFTTSAVSQTTRLGSLTKKAQWQQILDSNDYYQYYRKQPSDSVYGAAVIDFGVDEYRIKENRLFQNGIPFSGQIILLIDTNLQHLEISERNRTVTIRYNGKRGNDPLMLQKFLGFYNESLLFDYQSLNDYRENYNFWRNPFYLPLQKMTFTFKNGLRNGETTFLHSKKQPLAKLQFLDDQLNGKQVYFNYFNHSGFIDEHASEMTETPSFPSKIENYNRGKLDGYQLKLSSQGDTIEFYILEKGKKIGKPYTLECRDFNNYKTTRIVYFKDTIPVSSITHCETKYRLEEDLTKQTQTLFNPKENIIRTITNFGDKQDSTLLNYYDTLGTLTHQVLFKNGLLAQQRNFENGSLQSLLIVPLSDSIEFEALSIPSNQISVTYPSYIFDQWTKKYAAKSSDIGLETGELIRYDQYQQMLEKGRLSSGRKIGTWYYYSMGKLVRKMIYFDSIYNPKPEIKIKGAITLYDSLANPHSAGLFYDYQTEFNCSESAFQEIFQVQWSLLNHLPCDEKPTFTKLYFPNGVVMSEGSLQNGKPEGIWKLYHSDGKLFKYGKYVQGEKDGRWLEGDLSKVNFLGEYCLDTSSEAYNELIKSIDVRVTFYQSGKLISSAHYNYKID